MPSEVAVLSPRSVDGHIALSFMPQLEEDPELRTQLLRDCSREDLYLLAIGSFNDLVVRHDLRREAIRELAAEAELGPWALRWTALRMRAERYVLGERLTPRGRAEAEGASERLLARLARPTA